MRPLTVQCGAADPDAESEGFFVSLLMVLPSDAGDDVEQVLRAAIRPLIACLGLREEWFTFDEEDGSGRLDVDDDTWHSGGTVCGTYMLQARIGGDPFDQPPEEQVPLGPVLTDEECKEFADTVHWWMSTHVSLTVETVGLDGDAVRELLGEQVARLRTAVLGAEADLRISDMPPEGEGALVGALLGPISRSPEAAISASVAALGGWGPVSHHRSPRGPYLTAAREAMAPPEQGIVRMLLLATPGGVMTELAQSRQAFDNDGHPCVFPAASGTND
ncbi:hypothetical protein NLX86_20210 [Streptomyces sp. A3M-1-3]|uniref:hypothetical protein n=1 Tax=Streptomyces sp. A3M-1-3 TaxID=2962044 RepID=UPI0020B88DF6|nr:hypothetical protein [Streptomyces sp. A3M-1-3]MCP3820336.1 hypothetical protein [Streptomyces sp. A3M-1-3]